MFAQQGYDAVSVSMIAARLGVVKSALYKHYKDKQDLFDSILRRMEDLDAQYAAQHQVPEGTPDQMPEAYRSIRLDAVRSFTEAMFLHWTEDPFASRFRQLLTLEQYRSPRMARLQQQDLSTGPADYVAGLLAEITGDREHADRLALKFYGPMYLLYTLYNHTPDKELPMRMLRQHLDVFLRNLKTCCRHG